MSLAITALLAAVASELVVAANLPSSSEITWFQTFSLFSLVFGAMALFESVTVIYFFYYAGSDLTPTWWKWIRSHGTNKLRNKVNENDDTSAGDDAIHDDTPENGITVGVSVEGEYSTPHKVTFKDDEAAPFASTEGGDPNRQKQERRPSHIYTRDADDFIDDLEAENNKRWKHVASCIDETCRVVIIPAYIIVLAVLLQRPERL